MKRILLTGASGFLGGNFCHFFSDKFEIHAIFNEHFIHNKKVIAHQLDLVDFDETTKYFQKIRPDAVIHLAAVSDPNYCEINPLQSEKINIEVSETIAVLCKEAKIRFLFASTDLVFDGKNAPYKESDIPAPISIYGLHKSIAEQSILDIYPMATICRLPLLYGNGYNNKPGMLKAMIEKLERKESQTLFTDEYRTLASAKEICEGMMHCADHQGGIFHLGGDERISRYHFGLLVCKVFGFDKQLLIKGKQKEANMPAPRPKDVSMINTKAKEIGWNPGGVKDNLYLIFNEMQSEA